ncbi:MAG: GNVR domain-containing protein [Gemmatimonadaceae bacterium]
MTPDETRDAERPPLTFSVWVAGIIRRRRLVMGILVATVLLAVAAGMLLPPIFRAKTSFVANSSTPRMPSGLSGMGGFQGLTSQLGLGSLRDPSESPNFYAELVQSEELRRRLATSRFPDPRTKNPGDSATLVDILRIKHRDPARRLEIAVARLTEIVKVRFELLTSLVRIDVDTPWRELSADLANRTVDLVSAFNREQRLSRAQSKRVFLEGRLLTAYDELAAAEERQRLFYDQNRQWRTSPSLTFEESRLRRNVELVTDLYIILRQQFEGARLEEFNDAALITVVDRAVVPRKAHWPRWGILLTSAVILGTMLGALAAGVAVVLEDWRSRNPAAARFFRDSLPGLGLRRRKPQPGRGAVAT